MATVAHPHRNDRREKAGKKNWAHWTIIAAIAFGVICRLSQYFANPSIFFDEAFVALNAMQKTPLQLFGSLDWNEAAPPGFLLLEKFMVSWFGQSEYALRAIPLLASLAALFSFAALARSISRRSTTTLWAVLLAAVTSNLIWHAALVKHFSFDALSAVLLTWLAVQTRHDSRRLLLIIVWGLTGALSLWLSYASLFVFAGTSLALASPAYRIWRQPERIAYVAANVAVLASFGLLWGPIQAQRVTVVLDVWINNFPDTSTIWTAVFSIVQLTLKYFSFLYKPSGSVLFGLFVLGMVSWWRAGRRFELLCLVLPIGMSVVASFMHYWPIGGSHMIFTAPAVCILAAQGIEEIFRSLARWKMWVAWSAVALFFAPVTLSAAHHIVVPRNTYQLRSVIEFVLQHRSPGDRILAADPATFLFYTGELHPKPSDDPDPSARVWLVSPRKRYEFFPADAERSLAMLRARRPQWQMVEEYGAAAYLFGPVPAGTK